MKTISRSSILVLLFFGIISYGSAQENQFTKKYKESTIAHLCKLMNDFYVFPEVALQTEAHLQAQLAAGHFEQFTNNESFAKALTESVQSINKDKHMRIRENRSYEAPPNSSEGVIEATLDRLEQSRMYNSGCMTVKIMEGNVGYLDLRGFAGLESGKDIADAYMKILSRTDAIIIDLSQNGGGSPSMVQYLCSYFFSEKLHLNSLYWREGDITEEFWTLDEVGGDKMSDVPLYVITSAKTFSGAEEFSYNMQTQKRATLVGQTTGGGANPGRSMRLNDMLSVFIPTGRAINPITNTSWEGTGVVPEVKTNTDETLNKAHVLAMTAAEAYRKKTKERFTVIYKQLEKELDNFVNTQSDEIILESLTNCLNKKLLHEWDINSLGYDYLLERKKPHVAESIFKANTILHPDSPNVFDSYAEALMINGDLQSSLLNYERAVELAVEKDDRDVDLFKNNLEMLRRKLAKSK